MKAEKNKMTAKAMKALLSLFIAAVGSRMIYAEDVKPSIKVGGLVFAHYEYVTSNNLKDGTTSQNYNSFDVSRIYLNAEGKYDDKISGFVNLEADLISREFKANRVYLKKAELRYFANDYAKIYFGLISVPWRDYEEGIWHRYTGKDLEDTEGLGNATDRGIRLSGKIPMLGYHFLIVNGGGTGGDNAVGATTAQQAGDNENTSFNGGGRLKSFIAQLDISPFESMDMEALKGLEFHLQGLKGDKDEVTVRNRIFAGVSYKSKPFQWILNYYNADNSNYDPYNVANYKAVRAEGFSTYAFYYPKENLWLFARYDRFVPNINPAITSNAKGTVLRNTLTTPPVDGYSKYIWGIGYQLTKGVRVTFDHEYIQQDSSFAPTTLTDGISKAANGFADQSTLFLHTETKF